ncbi:MAG: FtsH protease activity modulator HflK [Calditrichota bacterium]
MQIPRKNVNIGGEVFEVPDLSRILSGGLWKLVLVLIGIWLISGVYIVGADQQGVVRRFGKFVRVTSPGINWRLPFPFERVDKPRVSQVKRVEIGFRTIDSGSPARYSDQPHESVMLTGNLNIVDCDIIIQYRIVDAVKFLFRVRDIDLTVHSAAEASLRQVIGKHEIDEVLTTGKGQIQDETKIQLQQILNAYDAGVIVVAVQLQDVHPPKEVVEAFKDVASAREDQNRLINQAEGYRADVIPRTRGERDKAIKEAEAYAAERIKKAEGDAENFNRILAEYRKSKEVTRKRMLLETMEEILPGLTKYIMKTDKGGSLMNIIGMPPTQPTTGGRP